MDQQQWNLPGQETAASYPYYHSTMVRTGPDRMSGATRRWAISSIALGCLYLLSWLGLVAVGALHSNDRVPTPYPGGSALAVGLIHLAGVLVACGFIAGGVGVLKRGEWGRKALIVFAVIGAVLAMAGVIAMWCMTSSPAFLSAMTTQMLHRGAAHNLHGHDPQELVHISTCIMLGMVGFIGLLEVVYCSLLCWRMNAVEARGLMNRCLPYYQ